MTGFDETVFEKPLNAETKEKKGGVRQWLSEKKDAIKCCFQSGCKK